MKLRKRLGGYKRAIRRYLTNKRELRSFSAKIDLSLADVINTISITHKFNKLIICGNGNGINEIKDFGESDYMVVNYFAASKLFSIIKPKYYVVIDEVPFVNEDFFKSMLVPIVEKVEWEMYFFTRATFRSKKIDKLFSSNDNIHLVYWNCFPANHLSSINKNICYEHNLAVPCVENVMEAAIYLGIMLKYPEIELYGVNHDWTKRLFVDDDNLVRIYDQHFYDNECNNSIVYEMEPGVPIKVYEIMEMYAHIYRGYQELRQLADKKGTHILNCTKGSFIDAFDRSK